MTTKNVNLEAIQEDLASQIAKRGVPIDSVGELLGAGGFKYVFACVIDGIPEALKVTRVPSFKDRQIVGIDPVDLKRRAKNDFLAIQALNKLYVPTIVKLGQINQLVEWCDADGSTYIVWSEERLGESLEQKIMNKGYCQDKRELRRLLACGAVSLDALQKLQAVHRDFKPANVSVDFILFDFGLSYMRGWERHTVVPMGTHPFNIPPEVLKLEFNGDHTYRYQVLLGSKYDLFGLGQTAYRYCTRSGDSTWPEDLCVHRPDLVGIESSLVDDLRKDDPRARCTLDRLKDELWDELAEIVRPTKYELVEPLLRKLRGR